ncbi:hypothetical protein [Streptomyces sp. NPDC049040]|uniref:hypothetical protein n=1 Tax=Streptomyces sp. NPDC049040 TaxID=3365593 RepID=UPI0037168558
MSNHQPNPKTPSWGQQPSQPTGWTTPPLAPRPPKSHKGLKIAGGIVGGLFLIGIIVNAAGGGKKDDDKTTAHAAPVVTTATQEPAAAPATNAAAAPKAKPKPKPAAKTVLTESGHGIKSTKTFTVDGDWDLSYTYNCASFGTQGNFIVSDGGLGIYVNELGKKGSDTTHLHDGDKMHLEINSECRWSIKVIDIP